MKTHDWIWKLDGVFISSHLTAMGEGNTVVIQGLALKGNENSVYFWTALPLQLGYYVTIRNAFTGREEQFQGSTFNLPLEVASAVRRTI